MTWRPGAPRLILIYPPANRRILLDGVPEANYVFDEFDLDHACCELEVTDPETGTVARIPLRIEHIVDLPVAGITGELDLQELLLLHAGKYKPGGACRAARSCRRREGRVLGMAFNFWNASQPAGNIQGTPSIGAELERAPSIGAFQAQLRGPWGVCRAAERIVAAPERGELMRTEAWIYAQELVRVLKHVKLDGDPTASDRAMLCGEVVQWIWENVLAPPAATPGIAELRHFYEEAV